MPLIDPAKTSSPRLEYQGPVIPNYNFSNAKYETLGSADTSLGKMLGNYYDKGFIPEYSQANQRYYNQGAWTAHTNNLGKLVSAVPAGVMSLANAITSLPTALVTWTSPREVMERNPINQMYNAYKGFTGKAMPSFVRDDFNDVSAFGQLARPGELFSSSNESLQFLVEMLAGSYVTAPLKVGIRAASLVSKYNPIKNVLTPIKAPNIAKMGQSIDMGLTNAMLSASESYIESKDSYEQALAKVRNERIRGLNNYTDEEITKKASEAADNVFWQNMLTTSITNGAFMNAVRPWYKPGPVASRDTKLGIKFKDGEFINKFADKGVSRFEKMLYDKGYTPGVVTKSLLENIASEGLEESLQYSIQKVNELDDALASDTSFIGSMSRYLKEIGSLEVLNMTDDARLKSAMLGSIIGAGTVGLASAFKAGPVAEAKSARERRDAHLENLNRSYTDFVKGDIFEKEKDKEVKVFTKEGKYFKDEGTGEVEINPTDYEAAIAANQLPPEGGSYTVKGEYKFDAEGRPIQNAVAVAKMLEARAVHDEMDDYVEEESLRSNPDPLKLQLFRSRKMATLAKDAFDAGVGDVLLERLETLRDSPEDLLAMGVDPEDKGHIDFLINYTKKLETLWNTAQNATAIPHNSKQENVTNSKRRDYIYNLGARILTLDTLYEQLGETYNTKLTEFLGEYDTTKGDPTPILDKIYEFYRNGEELETLFKQRASLEAAFIDSNFNQDLAKEIKVVDEKLKKALNHRQLPAYSEADVKRLSSNLKVQELAKIANNQRTVAQNREILGGTLDQVLDTRNGFKNFKKIIQEKGKVSTIFDKNALRLIVNEELTQEAYDFFEERSILKEDYKRRSASTYREFYSELVDRFIEYFNDNLNNPNGETLINLATSLKQLIADIQRNDARLYEESAEKLTSMLLKIKGAVEAMKAPLQNLTDSPESLIERYETTDEQFSEEIEEAIAQYQEAQDVENAIAPFNTDQLISEIKMLVDGPFTTPSTQELKEVVALSFLEPAYRIMKVSDYDGQSISESYDDIVSVLYELQRLTLLRDKIMASKGGIVLDKYNDAIKALEDILSGVKQNRANRELKNTKENFIYAKALLDTRNTLKHKLSQESLALLEAALAENPVIAAQAFEDLFKENHSEEEAVNLIAQRQQEVVNNLRKILTPIFEDISWAAVTDDKMNKFITSPLRLVKHFIDATIRKDFFRTSYPNPNFKKFLIDYDLVSLLESMNKNGSGFVDRGNSILSNENAEALILAYLELDALNKLRIQVQSNTNNLTLQTKLLQNINDQVKAPSRPTPSSAQERVILQLAKWIKSPIQNTHHIFENVAALKAPPGAGKSLVVTPTAMNVTGLGSEEIMTAASNDMAAQNLATSVGKNTTNTVDTLIDALENGKVPPKTKLIILDEVGPISFINLDRLFKAFSKYNRENTAKEPVKMLIIYDPNQVVAGYQDIPDIEKVGYSIPPTDSKDAAIGDYPVDQTLEYTQNLYDLTPLSTSYRSDVAEIVDLFQTFVGDKEVSNVLTAASVDPKASMQNVQGAFVESDNRNLRTMVEKSIAQNPDRSRVIIVGTTERVQSLTAELAASSITDVKVATIDQVQGSTFDEVYVDIKRTESPKEYPGLYNSNTAYNKAMNTAISRAKHFAYVANITGTNRVDNSIPAKAAANAAQKNQDLTKVQEAKKEEITLLKKLVGDAAPDVQTTTSTPIVETVEERGEESEENAQTTNVAVSIRKLPKTPEDSAEIITDETEIALAEARIERIISTSKTLDEARDRIRGAGYSFSLTDSQLLNDFIKDRLDKKTKRTFAEWRNNTPAATPPAPEVGEDLLEEEEYYDNEQEETFEDEALKSEINEDELVEEVEIIDLGPTPISSVASFLEYPQNSAFSDVGTSKAITVNDELLIVKDNFNPSVRSNKERFMVLRLDGNGVYRKVAVLSDAEVDRVQRELGLDFSKLKPIEFRPLAGSNDFVQNDKILTAGDYYGVYLAEGSSGLTYKYSNGPVHTMMDDSGARATFLKWAEGMLGPDYRNKIENWDDDITKFYEFKVFHNAKGLNRYIERINGKIRIPPKLHVPYMIIKGVKLKGDKAPMAVQYIRLSSNVVNSMTTLAHAKDHNGNDVELTMETLSTFTNLIKEFHGELAKHAGVLPFVVHSMRMGEPLRNEDGSIDKSFGGSPVYAFHSLIKALSQQYSSKSKTPIKMFASEKEGTFNQKVLEKFPEIEATKLSKQLLLLAARIDSMQHYGDQFMIEKKKVKAGMPRNFDGHAQIVMNKLGIANFMITLPVAENAPGVTPLILRDYETRFVNKKMVETIAAKRLLGPVTAIRNNISYNPTLKQTIITKLKKLLNTTDPSSAKYKIAQEILAKNEVLDVHTSPLKLWQLEALVKSKDANNNYTKISEGFGLRAPVVEYTKEEEDFKPSWNVATNFNGVSPTRIGLVASPQTIEIGEQLETPKVTIQSYLMKNVDKPLDDLVTHILKNYNKEEIQSFASRMGTSSVSESVKAFVLDAQSSKAIVEVSASLKTTIKNLKSTLKSFDSNVELLEEVYKDSNYWKEDSLTKFGPRDNVRLMVLIKMFPQVAESAKLYRLATLYAQNKWYNTDEYKQLMEDNPEAIKALQEMVDAAAKIAKSRGFKVKAPKANGNVAVAVEFIAEEVAKRVRAADKTAEAVPVEISDEWRDVLVNAVYDDLAVPVIAAIVRNAPNQASLLGLPTEGSDNEIAEAAITKVYEEGLTPSKSMMRVSVEDEIGELLTDEEAVAVYESLIPPTSLPFLKKLFKKRTSNAFKIINFAEMQHQLGKNNWGLYKKGVVYVARHEQTGKTGSKIIRHEVLHKVIWGYLNPLDRSKLFQLAREAYGNAPLDQLEEQIAEAFANKSYEQPTSFWSYVKDIFLKLYRFFGFTYNNLSSLDAFFNSIDRAYYSGAPMNVDTVVERDMRISKDWRIQDETLIRFSPEWGALESFKLFENLLFETLNEIYEIPKTTQGKLLSFDAAIEETFNQLVATYENAKTLYPESAAEVREALRPILDPNGRTRKSIVDLYFPSTRMAETLAVKIAEAKQRRDNLTDALSEFPEDSESEAKDAIDKALGEVMNELSILDETFESELRNPATKLTGRVKHRLSNIIYLNKATKTRADFTRVYEILTEALSQVDNQDIYDYMDEVLSRLRKRYSVRPNAEFQRSVGGATTAFMEKAFKRIVALNVDRPIIFRKDVSDYQEYAVVSKDGSPVGNISKHDVKADSNYQIILRRDPTQSLDEFAKEIQQRTGIPYDTTRDAYYLYEETAFITSLVSAISSLVKSAPQTASVRYNYGVMSEMFFYARRSGKRYILSTELTTYFDKYVEKRRTFDELHGMKLFPNFLEKLPAPGSSGVESFKAKIDAVNEFLSMLELPSTRRVPADTSPTDFEFFYNTFYNSLYAMEEQYSQPPTEEEISRYGDTKYRKGASIIDDETSLRDGITLLLNGSVTAVDSQSFRRGDGKQAYLNKDASYQSSLLWTIGNAFTSNKTVSFPDLTVGKSEGRVKLTSSSPMLKYNPFITGKMSIVMPPDKSTLVVKDYDSMKRANSNYATMLRSENTTNFYQRNFNYGFLAAMSKSRGASYYQFLPNPSNNRTSIQMVSVKYLDEAKRRGAFEDILRHELNRPEVPNDKNYGGRREIITLPGVTTSFAKLKAMPFNTAVEVAYKEFVAHNKAQVENIIIPYYKEDIFGNEIAIAESNFVNTAKSIGIDTSSMISRAELMIAKRAGETDNEAHAKAVALEKKYTEEKYKILSQLMYNFASNFALQQHALSQIVYGDQAFYAHKEDFTKRTQVATASGDIPLVDAKLGLPPQSRVAIFQDPLMEVPIDLDNVRDDSFQEVYKGYDGQGYVLPEFYEKMAQAYSIESRLDITLKPVYASKDMDGKPFELKYSLIVLTDELVNDPKFVHLKKLRDAMRDHRNEDGTPAPIDQAVFNSAVKVGNPDKKNLSKFDTLKINKDSVRTIDNKFLRMQLNPAKDTDGSTSNPSQITAMINTNGKNTVEASQLYGLNSMVIEAGLKKVSKELALNKKGNLSKQSLKKLRAKLIDLTDGMAGAEDINDFLSYVVNGEPGVSLDLPLLAKKITASIASYISKNTVSYRFPGSKVVLQAEAGSNYNLQWKDENGYTEVILPDTYREFLKEGDIFTMGKGDSVVAFRIPSTNLHSAVTLKIKGFYPAPKGSKQNIIIAPSLIVYYHGSDFDIDTLFLMRKAMHNDGDVNLNTIISKYRPHTKSDALDLKDGDVYGYKTEEDMVGDMQASYYLFQTLPFIEKRMETQRASKKYEALNKTEEDYLTIIDYAQKFARNNIVNVFSKTLRDPKNRVDLLTPITTVRVSNNKSELDNKFEEDFEKLIELLSKKDEVSKIKKCK